MQHRDLYSHPDQTFRGTAYNKVQTPEEQEQSLELQRKLLAGETLIPPKTEDEPQKDGEDQCFPA